MKRSIISDQLSMDFEEALLKAKKHFEYIELHSLWNKTIEDLNDDEVCEVESLLKKYDMKVSCLSTTLFLMCPLYTDADSLEKFSDKFLVYTDTYEGHLECLKKCIEISGRFNTDNIRIFPFRLEKSLNKDFDDYVNDISEKLNKAVMAAEKAHKCLIIENYPYSYLPRGNMTYELTKKISSKSFKLLWDIGNSYRSEFLIFPDEYKKDSLLEEYKKIREQVVYFHLKDYRKLDSGFQHAAFGEGDIGFAQLLNVIQKDDGNRFISLEPEVNHEGVIKSIRNLSSM